MALTFPANPTSGQIYDQYVYDATAQSWRVYGSDTGITNVLATKANLNGGNTFGGNQTFSGRISVSGQPSFHAFHNPGGGFQFPSGEVTFNSTRHNIGGHYNTSNGRFTAPVTGSYIFSCHLFKFTSYNNDTNTYWGFMINGVVRFFTNHGVEGQDGGDTIAAVMYLNAGDYVSVTNVNGTMSSFSNEYNSFTGHFLG
jgi:hypothetical protein